MRDKSEEQRLRLDDLALLGTIVNLGDKAGDSPEGVNRGAKAGPEQTSRVRIFRSSGKVFHRQDGVGEVNPAVAGDVAPEETCAQPGCKQQGNEKVGNRPLHGSTINGRRFASTWGKALSLLPAEQPGTGCASRQALSVLWTCSASPARRIGTSY